jgi:hypothetical protein
MAPTKNRENKKQQNTTPNIYVSCWYFTGPYYVVYSPTLVAVFLMKMQVHASTMLAAATEKAPPCHMHVEV